jgi:hypothetical protein
MSFWNAFKEWLRKWIENTFGPEGIFSSGTEGHAFLIGISEVAAPWKPRHDVPADYEANGSPFKEYHYYVFGRACGVVFWLLVIIFFWKVIA